ncbi:LysM peptidoglycan-binding domain-containing protein [Globicatella sanguinis]|uniref:LysM peptidoglycan-binding domain-containing protein n=1 Tax=Globicatella sanguinis TaxID=13076 RepID=UPI00254359E2|nr:LysM peptidoglycan-binding domain-containing protein [Globicatella sanguinis]MDK7631679.1 LysM peptidoglycan-binding domain-containing protein [Globicatella sanguinis]WIK66251.1 LysM peptidoglycan-binding domain-containing protein [Globicatella sanguinis]WKT55656.1 LysM peptidoglycan-binding domain-containing protein [Globicatella sanguinis]
MKKLSKYLLISALTLGLVNPVFAQEDTTIDEEVPTEEVSDTTAEENVAETVSDGLDETEDVTDEMTEATAQYVIVNSSTRKFVFDNEEVAPQPWEQVKDAAAATEAEDGLKDMNIEWGRLNTDLYSGDEVLYEAGTPVFRVVNHDTKNTSDFAIFGTITYPGAETYGHVAAQYVHSEGFTYVEDAGTESVDVFTQAEAFKSAILENATERLNPALENELPALAEQPLFTENAEGVYELTPKADEETTTEAEQTTAEETEDATAEGDETSEESEDTTAEGDETSETTEDTSAEGDETSETTAEGDETTETTAEGDETAETTEETSSETSAESETTASQEQTYDVVEGDTLNKIAEKHGVTVEALKAANELTDDNIFVGQTLKIPAKGENEGTTTTSEDTPTQTETTTLAVSQETSVITTTTKDGKSLPQTGERNATIVIVGALVLAGLGVALITFNKKKENK